MTGQQTKDTKGADGYASKDITTLESTMKDLEKEIDFPSTFSSPNGSDGYYEMGYIYDSLWRTEKCHE